MSSLAQSVDDFWRNVRLIDLGIEMFNTNRTGVNINEMYRRLVP